MKTLRFSLYHVPIQRIGQKNLLALVGFRGQATQVNHYSIKKECGKLRSYSRFESDGCLQQKQSKTLKVNCGVVCSRSINDNVNLIKHTLASIMSGLP